jgi:NTE family protein
MKIRDNPFQSKLVSPTKSDKLFLILAFSGGGTRAASLSYGVLEALDQVEIPAPKGISNPQEEPARHTLLDEVDLITGVSGGSFTAAYYGLHGRDTFKEFREKVLLQDLEHVFILGLINPVNWVRLWSPRFGRSDMAQEYYDNIIFHGATLGDLASGKVPPSTFLPPTPTTALFFLSFPANSASSALISKNSHWPALSQPRRLFREH